MIMKTKKEVTLSSWYFRAVLTLIFLITVYNCNIYIKLTVLATLSAWN